ncbi:MAG: EAL domain-containing protein [Planctomycetota bacterium]|nr:EAL domain-containing protein [Planctomycetota bacterium]
MKIKALIVEDDEILLKNLKRFLELEGISADTAINGLEALEVIQQSEVLHDVIITDLNMPQMGGMQLVNVLQSQSRTKDIPIIVITAFGQKQNLLTALRSGVKDLLEKPWDADDLMASIHRVIPAPGSEPVLSDNYANQLYDYLFNVSSTGRTLPSILLFRFSFSGQVKTLASSMRPALLSTIEAVLQEVFPGDQWIFNKDDFSVAVFDCEGGSGELNIDSKAKLKSLQSRIARLFLQSAPEHQLAVFAPLVAAIFVDKSILASHQGSERSAVVERLESIVEGAKSGKGKAFLFTDDSINLPSLRLDVPSLINRAVQAKSSEFSIAWQPQIKLADGSIYGAEALARWNSPELGFVSPEKFISTAEDWGLIGKLGTLLRDIAMKEFLVMQTLEVALPRMSFNVSPFELLDPSFAEELIECVRSHEIPFEVVTAEITESASVLESKDGLNNLRLLKDSGMGLAVDDFGSGFTSLGALSEQPLTELKIDRSYLEGIADNPKLLAVVSNMVSLAEDIDAISVVEGIENKEQLEILRALGCNYGQGYYWSKPIPMADLGVLLQSPDPFPK